jgi:thioredoxin reductase (NADPH)
MSAALWCGDLGLRPLLIEQNSTLGGQLLWIHNPITNYLGAEAENGAELASKFIEHVTSAGIGLVAGREVTSVDLRSKSVNLGGDPFAAAAIVLATGVRRRKLGVPGEKDLAGRGILGSGARDRDSVRDKQVVIVGGGDAALENAMILSERAAKVYVVHRRESFSARDEFVSKARERPNVEFVLESGVTAIGGDDRVRFVTVEDRSGAMSTIECDAVLIRIGVEPNTHLFSGQIELDHKGYVVVDKELRTSVDGVWAIGDVAHPVAMTVSNAVGAGSVAAKSIAARL